MAAELTPEQRQAIADELYAGRKIAAIKRLRELSGLDLKESKEIIDRLETDLRAAHPERFAAASSKSGCAILLLFLGVVAGMLIWLLFRR